MENVVVGDLVQKGAKSILAVCGRGIFLNDFNCVINQFLLPCLETNRENINLWSSQITVHTSLCLFCMSKPQADILPT